MSADVPLQPDIPLGPLPGIKQCTPGDVTREVMRTMTYLRENIEKALVGRVVRVKSDHNGQPYGRSRKSWRGQVCRIKAVHIDLYSGIGLQLEGHEYECFIEAEEVEFA